MMRAVRRMHCTAAYTHNEWEAQKQPDTVDTMAAGWPWVWKIWLA